MATVFDVARFFIFKNNQENPFTDDDDSGYDPITHMKLQKLVYYAQGANLAILDTPLFNEKIEAWKHGPVSPDLYQNYKHYGGNIINEKGDLINIYNKITEAEKNVLNFVFNKFSCYTASKLREMSHQDEAWKDYYSENDQLGVEIPILSIKKSVKSRLIDEFKFNIEITLENNEVYVVDIINVRGALAWNKSKEKALEEAKNIAFDIIADKIAYNEYS